MLKTFCICTLAMSKKIPAVGIDLGTTYSCVGVWKNEAVEIIANDQGNRTTPSYVAFTDSERLIGDAAKNQVARNPENSVFDAKRLIGRKFADPIVQADAKLWPFKLVPGANDKPMIQVHYQGEDKKVWGPGGTQLVLPVSWGPERGGRWPLCKEALALAGLPRPVHSGWRWTRVALDVRELRRSATGFGRVWFA